MGICLTGTNDIYTKNGFMGLIRTHRTRIQDTKIHENKANFQTAFRKFQNIFPLSKFDLK
jgi:hypothetical protein